MEYKEFIKKHGKEKVKFGSYYKYMFSFENDSGLYVSVGGDADDIYRLDVDADKEYLVSDLEPNYASLNGETIFDNF